MSGFFPGCIDEVELFRRALAPSEIAAIYAAGPYGKCRPGNNGVVPPLVIKCPPNQTIFTCSNSAVADFKPSASGHLGPILCVLPSGSVFPIGTNTVTCTVTNICGATASCSFLVIVKPYSFPRAVLEIPLRDLLGRQAGQLQTARRSREPGPLYHGDLPGLRAVEEL